MISLGKKKVFPLHVTCSKFRIARYIFTLRELHVDKIA